MEMTNRVDGGSCPQSPAALRRGDSGGTAPHFAWPLRGKCRRSLVSDLFSKSIRPYGTPAKNWSPGLTAHDRIRAADFTLNG